MKYTCKKSKEEIIKTIVEEFEKVSNEYEEFLSNKNEFTDLGDLAMVQERKFGKYIAMIDLLKKMEIHEE